MSWRNKRLHSSNRRQPRSRIELGLLGHVLQIQIDLKILASSATASLIRHGDHPNDELRIRNMDTLKRTRKNDSIDAAQNAPPHHTNKKKIQEEDSEKMKRKWKRELGSTEKEKDGEERKENHGSSEDETADGNSSNTDRDQDNDISFMKDTDVEIDTADIEEEEEWIERVKRSTDEAMERMITAKIQCWIKTHRSMKWRLAMRISSLPQERWVMKAAG